MTCKQSVRVHVLADYGQQVLRGFYHKAGCMGARYPHLDLECARDLWLCEVARVRGAGLSCWNGGGCVVLTEHLLGVSVRVCVEGCRVGCVGGRVYVMRTRSGMLYVGPIVVDC